jgi:uncharacterized repeat protein (TIGR03833 family)
MTTLMYNTMGGKSERYFKIKKKKNKNTGVVFGEVLRISCAEYNDPKKNTNIGKIKPNVGDNVTIITKPYNIYNCITGNVKDVLTRSKTHTRGHKVRLQTGDVGRVLKIHK